MRRLLYFLSFCFIVFIVYYDLTSGTLPVSSTNIGHKQSSPAAVKEKQPKPDLMYSEAEIKPGDTILSIIEQREGKISKPIDQVISDFRMLNKGKNPEDIQIGKRYKIPLYKE